MFLRGSGSQSYTDAYGTVVHQSETLGVIQGDAIRNITGRIGAFDDAFSDYSSSNGIVYLKNNRAIGYDYVQNSVYNYAKEICIDTSITVPTTNENRPINIAVYYLIKAEN